MRNASDIGADATSDTTSPSQDVGPLDVADASVHDTIDDATTVDAIDATATVDAIDVNGDGHADGAPDLAAALSNNTGGAVSVFLGTATSLNTTAARTLSAELSNAGFGRSIARSSP